MISWRHRNTFLPNNAICNRCSAHMPNIKGNTGLTKKSRHSGLMRALRNRRQLSELQDHHSTFTHRSQLQGKAGASSRGVISKDQPEVNSREQPIVCGTVRNYFMDNDCPNLYCDQLLGRDWWQGGTSNWWRGNPNTCLCRELQQSIEPPLLDGLMLLRPSLHP